MKLAIINGTKKRYGGVFYEEMVKEVLSPHFDIQWKSMIETRERRFKVMELPILLRKLFHLGRTQQFQCLIRDFDVSLLVNPPPTRNIIILHHLNRKRDSWILNLATSFLIGALRRHKDKIDKIVVVSKFWKEYLEKLGIKNVQIIYNAFDLNEFNAQRKEVAEFRKRLGLDQKPILYVGNAQKEKGIFQTVGALTSLDVHVVSSGIATTSTNSVHLHLNREDYLLLLKASSLVVLMSQFEEGWCRIAHEAMLSRTPVIGSGAGGMKELLENGEQIICEDFSSLKEKVQYLLEHPQTREQMGEKGYRFASQFTKEKFKEEWLKLIQEVLK